MSATTVARGKGAKPGISLADIKAAVLFGDRLVAILRTQSTLVVVDSASRATYFNWPRPEEWNHVWADTPTPVVPVVNPYQRIDDVVFSEQPDDAILAHIPYHVILAAEDRFDHPYLVSFDVRETTFRTRSLPFDGPVVAVFSSKQRLGVVCMNGDIHFVELP